MIKNLNKYKKSLSLVSKVKEEKANYTTKKSNELFFQRDFLWIYNTDFLKTESINESSIDLIVTSPPYNVDIKYKDKIMASSNAEFRVIRSYEIIIVIGIILLIITGIFFYLRLIKKREEKDVMMIKRKEKKLEKEIKKLEKNKK